MDHIGMILTFDFFHDMQGQFQVSKKIGIEQRRVRAEKRQVANLCF